MGRARATWAPRWVVREYRRTELRLGEINKEGEKRPSLLGGTFHLGGQPNAEHPMRCRQVEYRCRPSLFFVD